MGRQRLQMHGSGQVATDCRHLQPWLMAELTAASFWSCPERSCFALLSARHAGASQHGTSETADGFVKVPSPTGLSTGACLWFCFRSMSSRFSNFSTGNDNNALLSTGEFLRFTGEDNTATFVPGVATVRSAALHGQWKRVQLAKLDHLCQVSACLWGQTWLPICAMQCACHLLCWLGQLPLQVSAGHMFSPPPCGVTYPHI